MLELAPCSRLGYWSSMTSRRRFICSCSALAAVLTARGMAPADELGFGTFRALVNSRFTARQADGGAQALELVRVDGDGRTFSLLFSGDIARRLDQDTYAFEHVELGRFEMFIVPVGRAEGSRCYYEAVFNLKSYG